ncbi:MAG: sporulation protein YabP [Clostridia bacterium]|nr:sporulation protein YabP [Clostridia bacterium]
MEKAAVGEHSISMMNRAVMALSGVTDVSEFSDVKVMLKTTMGDLCIKGKKLSINQLNTENGTLDVRGEIHSMQYTTGSRDGFFAGLFK